MDELTISVYSSTSLPGKDASELCAPFSRDPSQQQDHSDRDLSSVPMEGGPSRFLSSQCHHDPRSHFFAEKVPFFSFFAFGAEALFPAAQRRENFDFSVAFNEFYFFLST